MQITNQWEELGEERGLKLGEERGLKLGEVRGLRRGETAILLRQLTRKFGPIPAAVHDQVANLSQEKLEKLADALLDFAAVDQLHTWLARQG